MSALTTLPKSVASSRTDSGSTVVWPNLGSKLSWAVWGASAFLVSIPVFVQAPLVRMWPWVSLLATVFWVVLGIGLRRRGNGVVFGDLTIGFSLSWLAGSIYWGWFRWEPLIHLPIEAIGVPLAIAFILRRQHLTGAFFYLGSLLGTGVTDLYFWVVHLMPYWRQAMQADVSQAVPVLRQALLQMQTPWGLLWVGILVSVLCLCGLWPFVQRGVLKGSHSTVPWWAFSGAVMSTLAVDGLFWLAARCA